MERDHHAVPFRTAHQEADRRIEQLKLQVEPSSTLLSTASSATLGRVDARGHAASHLPGVDLSEDSSTLTGFKSGLGFAWLILRNSAGFIPKMPNETGKGRTRVCGWTFANV